MTKRQIKPMFRVTGSWIDYAHGPGAESGHKLSTELCELPRNRNGSIEIPPERLDLVAEIESVCGLYVGGDDNNLYAAGLAARCKRFRAKVQSLCGKCDSPTMCSFSAYRPCE
jgi:hypothetical protein